MHPEFHKVCLCRSPNIQYRKRRYPKRPLMGPTLEITAPKLPAFWENTVK